MRMIIGAVALAMAFAVPAAAKVAARSPSGFAVIQEADVSVPPRQAFDAFVAIGKWWDMEHSYSHDGANMHMDLKPGGQWYETLPDGGYVNHLDVIQADIGERLVLRGGLGPLAFMGVSGSLVVTFEPAPKGTHVNLAYAVGGFDPAEFRAMSRAVDGVLAAQVTRYAAYVNTGKP